MRTVAAKDVAVGDYIWIGGFIFAYQWTQVHEVSTRMTAGGRECVVLRTDYYDTWKHSEEGVTIRVHFTPTKIVQQT